MSSSPASPAPASETRNALIAATVCYTAWGVFPLLFMAMARTGFTAGEILAHRALWALLFATILVVASGQFAQARRVLTTPATLGWLALSTTMILINWAAYVWATTRHHTLEASLGYYINPLLNMVAGMVLFRERIDRWGWVAIGMAAIGVVLQTLALGRAPWLSILIALSFAAYGVIRKKVAADAQTGLFVECLLMIPFGAALLIWLGHAGQAVGFASPAHWAWSISSGLATVLPLALFAWSARRLPLSTIGFLQFLAPTLQFAIGVASGEALTPLRIASFVFIWTGAGVFAFSALWKKRAERLAIKTTVDATGRQA
ncbi:EamA family transporter RarD [soil metagenome]